jgi:heme oxygenase
MAKADPEQLASQQTEGLLGRARTVSGDNIRGAARIVSLAELKTLMRTTLQEHGGVDEELMQQREAQLKEGFANRERELQERIAELERQLADADQNKAEAVQAAKQQTQARITELEGIIASDDARSRAAFLEQEVQRLQALIDRYETDLEAITCIDLPEITEDMQLCDDLQARFDGELRERIGTIKLTMEGAHRAIELGVKEINDKQSGTIYSCYDLLEHAVELRCLQHELLSIKQATG